MTLPATFRSRLRLPAVCAPMFRVTTPELVAAACRAGLIGALPRANAPSQAAFDAWLARIGEACDRGTDAAGAPLRAPIAVNLSTRLPPDELEANLAICVRRGVEIVVSATGDPTELTRRAHGHGLLVYCDAINLRFADKAIAAGADGIVAIGSGGGGHSGTINHLTLVDAIRRRFGGTLVMAGAISGGAAIRAAEVLGADLAYLGTRFIATQESGAAPGYKQMLVDGRVSDLVYTPRITGVAANWLAASLRGRGLDPDDLPVPARAAGRPGHEHLPEGLRPWADLWSAGQGIEQIDDVPTVEVLVERLHREYRQACEVPSFGDPGEAPLTPAPPPPRS